MGLLSKHLWVDTIGKRFYSCAKNKYKCKLLVVGAGTGGCSLLWRFSKSLGKNDVILLEPSTYHYYQPLFSLIAAGIKNFNQSRKPMKDVLPTNIRWLKDCAEEFDPCNNVVWTKSGDQIYYDYMVIAVGVKNDYDLIPGLQKCLDDYNCRTASIYSPKYCVKTWRLVKELKGGHAIFTFPKTCAKCAGAAQKIMYLIEDYSRKNNTRHLLNIMYSTAAPSVFGIPKYAKTLDDVIKRKCITVNVNTDLVEVTPLNAVFRVDNQLIALPYNFLHVTPPMSPPACLQRCEELTKPCGYLEVDRYTLQHKRFCNIFGLGDCIGTDNSKTAAAVSVQSPTVHKNLAAVMSGQCPTEKYNGYGACPILTSYKAGILAEFLYDKKIWETFPFDQAKERYFFYLLNTKLFPQLYWRKQIYGKWDGPDNLRKTINPLGNRNQTPKKK